MATGTRLAIGAAVVLSLTAHMAYIGASSSWQYYLTVDECARNASSMLGDRIRVSGKIAANSLLVADNREEASFVLQGETEELAVDCCGPFPDNLAEERQVVVEGRMNSSGRFAAETVLTRCASKYSSMSPASAGGAPSELPERRGN